MRILRVINSADIGGAELGVIENSQYHSKRGFETSILFLRSSHTHIDNLIRFHNVKLYCLGRKRLIGLSSFFQLIRIMKQYDIVQAHLFPSIYLVVLASYMLKNRPKLILTEHSTFNGRRDYAFFRWLDSLIYSRYDAVIAVSEGIKSKLNEDLKAKFKITVINNGVNLSRFSFSHNLKTPPDLESFIDGKFVLTQVSSFRKQKDHPTLIKALKLLPKNHVLLLAGIGPLLNSCGDLVKEFGLEGRVYFLGKRYDIPEILAATDVFILSSNVEGFGKAAVEAMATGIPTIGSDVTGLSDTIAGGGVSFERGNSEELASIIQTLSVDEVMRKELSLRGKSKALEYDLQRTLEIYESLYLKLYSE